MKRFIPFAAVALLAVSTSAFAIPLATVGGVDTLIDQASLGNSGDSAERGFIASALQVDESTLAYNHLSGDISGGANFLAVDGSSSQFAFDFSALSLSPTYFLIKVGSGVGLAGDGSTETFTHYLYENVSSLSYGVIDLIAFDRTRDRMVNIGLVSHVSTVGNGNTDVPEPATLGLLGLALASLGFARRRKPTA